MTLPPKLNSALGLRVMAENLLLLLGFDICANIMHYYDLAAQRFNDMQIWRCCRGAVLLLMQR